LVNRKAGQQLSATIQHCALLKTGKKFLSLLAEVVMWHRGIYLALTPQKATDVSPILAE
jgi:hypothetical protein